MKPILAPIIAINISLLVPLPQRFPIIAPTIVKAITVIAKRKETKDENLFLNPG